MSEKGLFAFTLRGVERSLIAQRESAVTDAIGMTFRQSVAVTVRKPRWMPKRLYHYLMRTIVVTTGPIETGSPR